MAAGDASDEKQQDGLGQAAGRSSYTALWPLGRAWSPEPPCPVRHTAPDSDAKTVSVSGLHSSHSCTHRMLEAGSHREPSVKANTLPPAPHLLHCSWSCASQRQRWRVPLAPENVRKVRAQALRATIKKQNENRCCRLRVRNLRTG